MLNQPLTESPAPPYDTESRRAEMPLEPTDAQRQSEIADRITVEGENRLHEEQSLSEGQFAFERFFMGGGQILIDVFGQEAVAQAVWNLTKQRQDKPADMYKLICLLEPNKQKRSDLYRRMHRSTDTLVRVAETEETSPADQHTEARAKRRLVDRSHLLSVELTVASSQQSDSFGGASSEDLYQLRSVVRPLVEACVTNPWLLNALGHTNGNLLKTIAKLDEEGRVIEGARQQSMAITIDAIKEELEMIKVEEQRPLDETIKTVAEAFEAFSNRVKESPYGKAVVTGVYETIRQRLSETKHSVKVRTDARNRPWQALLGRAEAAGR